jgi:hypothetical protein
MDQSALSACHDISVTVGVEAPEIPPAWLTRQ